MSWNSLYFGEENPSLKRQASIHLIMFVALSSPYPLLGNFAPQEMIFRISGLISVLITFAFLVFFWKERYALTHNEHFIRQNVFQKSFTVLLLVFVVSFFTGSFTMYTVPAMLTGMVGQEVSISAKFKKKRFYDRKSCNYRIYGDIFNNLIPSYMCLTEAQYHQPTNEFTIFTKKSFYGTLFTSKVVGTQLL